jgi:phage terminase small subunit
MERIMPRKALPKVPRVPKRSLNDRQERFALEYVKDFDRLRAYRDAGYVAKNDQVAATEACRLLRNPHVYAVILKEKAKIANKLGWDADKTLIYMELVFMEAMKERDYSGAISALDKLAKHYGLYEKHNTQRKYTQDDVEKLREKLEQHGVSFERVNYRSDN